jgi:hypothetical protein
MNIVNNNKLKLSKKKFKNNKKKDNHSGLFTGMTLKNLFKNVSNLIGLIPKLKNLCPTHKIFNNLKKSSEKTIPLLKMPISNYQLSPLSIKLSLQFPITSSQTSFFQVKIRD